MKRLLYLNLSFILFLFIIGCELPTMVNNPSVEFDPLKEINIGFDDNTSNIWAGLKVDKSSIKEEEELIFKFYYGTLLADLDFLTLYRKGNDLPSSIKTKLIIRQDACSFKTTEDETNQNYKLAYDLVDEEIIKSFDDFNKDNYSVLAEESKHEEIGFAYQSFNSPMGALTFIIKTNACFNDIIDEEKAYGNSITIYYEVCDDMVKLFDNYQDFYDTVKNNRKYFVTE